MTNSTTSGKIVTFRWIVAVGFSGVFVALIVQWLNVSHLRKENDLLRAQPQAVANEAPNQPTASSAGEAVDLEQLQKDRIELLRLRNEVRQLREIASAAGTSPPIAPRPATQITAEGQSGGNEVRALSIAA